MIRILIADDHAIVRRGLKQILAEESGMTVAGEAQNAQEIMELLRKQAWDVVVLDITMPGRGGLEVLKEIKPEYPQLPVLILSMTWSSPTMAGISSARAMMAVCEVRPPTSVAMPTTLSLRISAVSEGARS